MENEIAVVNGGEVRYDLGVSRAPKQVLAEAQEAAKALESVISQSKSVVKFNGKTYLAFEHWQTCGKFYGVTAKVISTEYIELDGAKGFLARAEAISTQTGQVISSAESMCMNDEPNWAKKPLFQLRSMAQTRACAKSLRNCLAWVVVLAGFEPSVAEEMTGDEQETRPPIAPPQKKSEDTVKFVPADYNTKSGVKDGKPWSKHGVKDHNGEWYGSFSDTHGAILAEAHANKTIVELTYKSDGKYKTITAVAHAAE